MSSNLKLGGYDFVGEVVFTATASAPTGYLKCNGAAVSRTTYADLFAAIGTTYGAGDGSTTFNVPDLRGEFIRGWDDGRGVDSSRTRGTWQAATRVIRNYWKGGGWAGCVPDIMEQAASDFDANEAVLRDSGSNVYPVGQTGPADRYVDGIRVRPRNVALLACIRY